ncbi:serine protease [Crocinitomicaceae bacterium]|nr:serine protease [Crocinitomicaceae bacterium]
MAEQNLTAVRNNAYGTPKDVMMSQLEKPLTGFKCETVATIAADDYEPLEACVYILSSTADSNWVYFYEDKYVGYGDRRVFPRQFQELRAKQLAKEAEESKPKQPDQQETPEPKPATATTKPFERKLKGSGSGFYINPEGHILTNHHVVDECGAIAAFRSGVSAPLTLVSTDPKNDLAVLKSGQKPPSYAKFRGGKGLKRGADITVIGYPLPGLLSSDATATFGYVNALRGMHDDSSRMQISAPIQSGNSGGPVLDNSGDVVGVIVSTVSDEYLLERIGSVAQNANFAINGLFARTFLDAREITYSLSSDTEALDRTAIVDTGTSFTTQILCYE